MKIGEPICVAPTGDVCGEGAVWHDAHQAVYWTDINRFLIHRLNLADFSVRTWFFEEPVTALALSDRDDTLVAVLGSQVILWEPATDARSDALYRLAEFPKVRFNDARCDPRGSLWIGSMPNNVNADGSSSEARGRDGCLVRVETDRRVTCWRKTLGVSNTLTWSPDRRHFYFGDSMKNVIWVYDYDAESGAISNERPFLEGFTRGVPDGSTMDAEGYLWNCRYYGNCVVRVAADGTIDHVVEMPVQNITTCTFGGAGLSTLFVTTASADAPRGDRLAGSLFSIATDVKGQPENRFRYFGGGR